MGCVTLGPGTHHRSEGRVGVHRLGRLTARALWVCTFGEKIPHSVGGIQVLGHSRLSTPPTASWRPLLGRGRPAASQERCLALGPAGC